MKLTAVFFGVALLLTGAPAAAQQALPSIAPQQVKHARESFLTCDSLLIGDQVLWNLPLETGDWEDARRIEAPELPATVTQQVEVLGSLQLDTLLTRKKIHSITAQLRLTCFDAGDYALPYMPLYLHKPNGRCDTLWFKGPLLHVATLPIDTTTYKAYGIKPQWRYPLTVGEVATAVGILALLAVLVWAVCYLVRRSRRHLPLFGAPKPKEPAHVIALRQLDKIRAQALWKTQKTKQFYTQLTDTLRVYLYDRWGIQAMEQTSAQMMDALREQQEALQLDQSRLDRLGEVLSTSDLVKFAKWVPSPQESEEALQSAVTFVTATAQYTDPQTESAPQTTKDE